MQVNRGRIYLPYDVSEEGFRGKRGVNSAAAPVRASFTLIVKAPPTGQPQYQQRPFHAFLLLVQPFLDLF